MIRCLTMILLLFSGRAACADPPNIILILLDDAGYGDFSCYNTTHLKTPAIDRMRSEGMKFTQFYAGSTVCAPSRCVLLTGKHAGHARVRGNSPGMLLPEDTTLADVLKDSGYDTACLGKWGVGAGLPLDDPNRNGFDQFFGYISMWHAHNFYPEFLIRNGQRESLRNVVMDKWKDDDGRGVATKRVDYVPEILTQEVLKYIESHQDHPFFLYYALNVPHANNEAGRFNESEEKGMEVPNFGPYADQSWPGPEKGFAAIMSNIDVAIDRIMKKLDDTGLDKNTIILLTSDNGPHQEGGHTMEFFDSNSQLRGMKRDLYEGGIRVPLIVRWPGTVEAGSTSHHISAFQDLLPTFADLAGTETPAEIDGISFAPTLKGNNEQQRPHEYLYWEFTEQQGKRAVRQGDWKLIQTKVSTSNPAQPELYNLKADIKEQHDVAAENPEIVEKLRKVMDLSHTTNVDYPLFAEEKK